MVPLDHIQRAHPLPSSYQVHLLLQDLDLRANPHFHHGKDQVISIQHQHLLLNATHSQVWESDNLSMQISFMYMDPAEDVAIFPVSRAASYRWKGILSTSTVCFYSRNLLQQLLACFLLLLVPTIDQDETFLWAIWSIFGEHQGVQCSETITRGSIICHYFHGWATHQCPGNVSAMILTW